MKGRLLIWPSLSRKRSNSKVRQVDPRQLTRLQVNTVDKSVAKAIAAGRQQKNLTQKELATVPDAPFLCPSAD